MLSVTSDRGDGDGDGGDCDGDGKDLHRGLKGEDLVSI